MNASCTLFALSFSPACLWRATLAFRGGPAVESGVGCKSTNDETPKEAGEQEVTTVAAAAAAGVFLVLVAVTVALLVGWRW